MAELGYFEPIPGVYGTANPATDSDPVARAELQERFAAMQRATAGPSPYVPPSMAGPNAPEWATQTGGPSSLPIVGWTAQKDTGPAFHPYDTTGIGRIPDWDAEGNPLAAGSWDMNQEVGGAFAPNRLNRAPIGDAVLQYDDQPNPNTINEGGLVGDLEY